MWVNFSYYLLVIFDALYIIFQTYFICLTSYLNKDRNRQKTRKQNMLHNYIGLLLLEKVPKIYI